MKRYSPNVFGDMYPDVNGKWVEHSTAVARQCPRDAQEGFLAFLARRGVAKFHSLYGAVLREIDQIEDEAATLKAAHDGEHYPHCTLRAAIDKARLDTPVNTLHTSQ